MYSVWLTQEQQQIWRGYLTMVSHLQTAMHRQLQQDCELSLSDYDVLVALSERGPQRINELGEALAWEQSRLSHQLRRMRGRGLVHRHGTGGGPPRQRRRRPWRDGRAQRQRAPGPGCRRTRSRRTGALRPI